MQCSTVDADSSPEANDQYVMGPLLDSTANYGVLRTNQRD
jgi:hypothetical protein